MELEEKNAKITSTQLGRSGRGIMSSYLHLDYGGSAQGFGGYVLSEEWGMEYIKAILDTVGIDDWEDLPGTHIRVRAEHDKVHAIGNIMDDKWFYPSKDLDEFAPKKDK